MAEIEVHFTEYFEGDTIVILCEGRELYTATYLTTDVRTSLACIVRVNVPTGQPVLTFEIPSKNVAERAKINVSGLKYLGVALINGNLRINPVTEEDFSREPRGYA